MNIRILTLCFFMLWSGIVHSSILKIPNSDDPSVMSNIFVPSSEIINNTIAISNPNFSVGATVYINVLIPPGVEAVSIDGQATSFNSHYFAVFEGDMAGVECLSVSDCAGKTMVPILDRLGGRIYPVSTTSGITDVAQYVTIVLKSEGASQTYSVFTIRMEIANTDWYDSWRSQRSWAGGTSQDTTGIEDISLDPNASLPLCSSDENHLSTVELDGSFNINVRFDGQVFKMQLMLTEEENGNFIFDVTNLAALPCRLN